MLQILTFSRQNDQEATPLHVGPLVKETLKLIRATVPAVIELLAERFPAARLRAATLVWQPQVFPRRPFSSTVELLG